MWRWNKVNHRCGKRIGKASVAENESEEEIIDELAIDNLIKNQHVKFDQTLTNKETAKQRMPSIANEEKLRLDLISQLKNKSGWAFDSARRIGKNKQSDLSIVSEAAADIPKDSLKSINKGDKKDSIK